MVDAKHDSLPQQKKFRDDIGVRININLLFQTFMMKG